MKKNIAMTTAQPFLTQSISLKTMRMKLFTVSVAAVAQLSERLTQLKIDALFFSWSIY